MLLPSEGSTVVYFALTMIHQRQLEERSRDAVAITSANHAPILQTITWFLLASMLLGVAIRMLTKVYLVHRLALDDILLAFAMVREDISGLNVGAQGVSAYHSSRCSPSANP